MSNCKVCGKEFPGGTWYGKGGRKGQKSYCSPECRKKDAVEHCICKTCGKPFGRKRLSKTPSDYCSVACTERNPCPFCGKTIIGRNINRSTQRRFCSHRCFAAAMSSEAATNYQVLGLVATLKRTGKIACERCGEADPFKLDVHHRDSDHGNVSLDNLETICANCHKLETYKTRAKRTKDIKTAEYIAANRISDNTC